MRELVLTAYEYQCAFCGYDSRIGAVPVGLEAAHVRWWAFDGPDDVGNGLCLVDWLQEEHGPATEDEHAAALDELEELDAEHERRRTAGQHNAGEAA
ncbi:hypothetical protein OHA62_20950 [Streptomyces sp. NBC_00343]|nr:HNH endonuclease [Streptomyces sp. NBC_00343]